MTGQGTATTSIRRLEVAGRRIVVKSASGRSRALLRREAELLDRFSAIGSVEAITVRETDERTDLVLADAGERNLTDAPRSDPENVLRALRDGVRAVAALHDCGWTHGALCSDHIVMDSLGHGRLCSLGSARTAAGTGSGHDPRPADPPLDDPLREELTQLASLVERVDQQVIATLHPLARLRWRRRTGELRRLLRAADHRAVPPTAGELVDALDRACRRTTTNPPGASGIEDRTTPRARPLGGAARAFLGTAAAFVAITLLAGDSASSGRAEPNPSTISSETATDVLVDVDGDGSAERVRVDGNLIHAGVTKFRLGEDGDVVEVGDWDCNGEATPLLLRPSSGAVVAFDRWAEPGRATTGRWVTTIAGAQDLRRRPGQDGCARAQVVRADGSAVSLDHTNRVLSTGNGPP